MDAKNPVADGTAFAFADPAFRGLSEVDRRLVLARMVKKAIKTGGHLYRRGDEPDGFYVILKGLVRITGTSQGGDEFILDLCGRSLWIGELSVLEEIPRSHDAVAETDAELLFLACADFERLISECAGFARALLRMEARRFRRAADWAERSATVSMPELLALRLVMLVRRDPLFRMDQHPFKLELSQETLARLVGSTRQRVNQVLQEFEEAKLIRTSRGRIVILDLPALEKMSPMI